MKLINIIVLVLFFFAAINVSSAAQELPFKRVISVTEWGMQFSTKEKIDQVMNDVSYMNGDAIIMYVGSEYFEAVRDPAKKSWDYRASWNMLEYAITKAHEKNIQLHVFLPVNSIIPVRAESRLWGNKYNVQTFKGDKDPVRLDVAFNEVQDYEIGLLGFIAKHYPTLDGIHIEEPFYTTQSYSPPIVARVKAKYNGYDIVGKTDSAKIECRGSSMKGLDPSICPTFSKIYDVERDAFNEFFIKIRASVNANKANPDLLLSANAANGYRPLHGFDPGYMSDNHLLDWYVAQMNTLSLSSFNSGLQKLNMEVDDIPVVPAAYITWSSLYPDPNPAVLSQVAKTCEYGGNAEFIFAYAWRNKIVDGKTVYQGLHNIPPSSLCNPTIVAPTPTFSPSAGKYSTSQSISISTSTTATTIRYTLDGTTPDETSSIYSKPILISSTTTLKAKVWKTGFTPGSIKSEIYTIGTPVVSSITVSPSSASMVVNSIQAFSAQANDQFGNPIPTTVTWTSSNESAGIITSSGIFTALAEGTTTINAVNGPVSGTAIAVITASSPITNIIENPGFESGTTSWMKSTNGIVTLGAATPGYEGSYAGKLAISSINTNIQLYQSITLEPNTHYRLSFAAYSNTGNDMIVKLILGVSPYSTIGSYQANLSNTWQTFTTEFDTTGFAGSLTNTRLQFWLAPFAQAGDIYYIDDIRLEKIIAPSLPIITTHPESQTVMVGQIATFCIITNGTEPLSYQWQKNGQDIPDETNECYEIPVTTIQDNGTTYRVNVTNTMGSVMSNDATLILIPLPNIITNPGFESGITSWNFFTNGIGTFNAAPEGYEGNNSAVLVLNRIGTNVQLYQTGIDLEPDTDYRLSFAAYSTSGNDLNIRLINHVSPYNSYMPDYIADLGTNWQTFTTEFNTTGFTSTVSNARLQFYLLPFAKAGDTYYIDNVRLENLDVIPLT